MISSIPARTGSWNVRCRSLARVQAKGDVTSLSAKTPGRRDETRATRVLPLMSTAPKPLSLTSFEIAAENGFKVHLKPNSAFHELLRTARLSAAMSLRSSSSEPSRPESASFENPPGTAESTSKAALDTALSSASRNFFAIVTTPP